MTVAELHKIVVAGFASQDKKTDGLRDDVLDIKICMAKRSGAFAVLGRFGLVLLGIGSAVAGAAIINAL